MATRIVGVDNVAHVVGTGDNRIILVLPDIYAGIGSKIGVTKLTGDPPTGVFSTTVGRAVAEGAVRKIKISYIAGTGSTAKRKIATLIVSAEKAGQARATLIGSTYRDYKIKTAYYPTRIHLG